MMKAPHCGFVRLLPKAWPDGAMKRKGEARKMKRKMKRENRTKKIDEET
jgi:hypothetical protein